MNLQTCPYCDHPGLVTTMRASAHGLEVSGKCATCGYSYDSEYTPGDQADDLPGEFTRPMERGAAD
jgi:hypothetical protein